MSDPIPGRTDTCTAEECADDKDVQRLVFDLLARGMTSQAEIRSALVRAGHAPATWTILRDRWAEHLVSRRVPIQWRHDYALKVAE